ncbi:MAG TPA: hypothetical protein VNN72_05580 [Polyangiaceae bacterium]|nr:hypothetical protein [Polyangiaceae bacterium]
MDRIAFIKLGITVVATEAWLSGCADEGDDAQASGGAGAGGATNPASGGAGAGAGSPATSGAGGAAAGVPAGAAGSAGAGGTGTAQCTTDANLVQTSMESHDHLPLTTPITADQLNAGSPTEYALPLEQNHIHTLTFTDADFEKLRSGMILSKRSSTMMGHTHTYSIKCV